MAISQIIAAGVLDRRLNILGLTETEIKGEIVEAWASIYNTWGAKQDVSGEISEKAGAETATWTTVFTIRYNPILITEVKNYQALRIGEGISEPVYKRDLSGEVLFDLNGNPLIASILTFDQVYRILHFEELGRRVAWNISCDSWL